jgi:hypothetical protein
VRCNTQTHYTENSENDAHIDAGIIVVFFNISASFQWAKVDGSVLGNFILYSRVTRCTCVFM